MISMNKYNRLMEHVNPSPDLEQRLHDALDEPPVTATAPQDYDTTDALAAALSFPLALPQTLPDGYVFDSASDQFGMAVVVYADSEGHTLKYCMGKGEDVLTGMNHTVSGEKLEGTDALFYAETGYTSVEWKDSKYSYCFIADETFDTAVWQALVSSIK